jgi:two-component sensor histidine kinase/CheY-like chemotaxis protein
MPLPIAVLYIDDDPGLARLVQRALGRRNYSVDHASNAVEGFARLAASSIDVIALDHFLPTGTGLDFLARLRALPAAPPVIYVTASADAAVAVAALKAGAADYVPKAVGEEFIELLVSAIDQAVESERLKREHDRAEKEVREAKDRAEALLHEVNHRIANSLALLAAMVRMQANSIADSAAKHALGETQARITAIAGVHRRLYTSDNVHAVEISAYLAGLLQEFEEAMKANGHLSRIRLVAEPIQVPTDKAVSIGVIIAELVTNAFKYAYPEGEAGEVAVTVRSLPSGKVHLAVEDEGIGWTGAGSSKGTGVGSRIVAAMAQTLGSKVEYGTGPGCRVSVEFAIG